MPEKIVDYTQDEYHEKRHPEYLGNPDLYEAWSHFAKYAYFNHVTAGQDVLDFGGGMGNNLLSISKLANVTMVEPAPIGRETAEDYGIQACSDLSEIKGQKFDTILCRHVLEHIPTPLDTLAELREFLADDGKLVLVLPFESMFDKPIEDDLNHHLFCWNCRTISNLLIQAGYRVENTRFEYYGAKQKLIPIYKKFGGKAYARCVRFVGQICRFREIVAVASPRR